MRWDDLFEDLEGQLAAAGQLDHEAQVAELVRAEQGAISLADRLRGHGEEPLELRLLAGVRVSGRLREVAETWFILESAPHRVLVPLGSVVTASGLGRRARAEGSTVRRTLSLGTALRTLARDRAAVTCLLRSAGEDPLTVVGTIDTVGSDYLEIMPARGASAHGTVAVPFTALIAVRSGS